MSYKSKWDLLLSDKRFREKSKSTKTDGRNPFENDYGRLILSSPIRRLQDKTQVFPLEQSDYIRTRLTHSLEVSYIASSIGQSIEKLLLDKNEIDDSKKGYLSSLLRVSGLIHDLGNPPFGHFGEGAIKEFFTKYFEKKNDSLLLNENEKNDFLNFDGNVQTLRILSKLYYFEDEYGYNLTYSSLASIIKYPSNSTEGNKGKEIEKISKRKFGYFQSELDRFIELNKYLDLNDMRSPIVYLMEAADDIAYSAADIEDGVKLKIININDIKDIFEKKLDINKKSVIDCLDNLIKEIKLNKIDESIAVQKFRIFTQKIMIDEIIKTFEANYDDIMSGNLNDEIIDISNAKDIRKAYKALQYTVFDNHNVIKKEIAGWEAIYGLLKIFVNASEKDNFKIDGGNCYEARLFKLISSTHRHVYEQVEKYPNEQYKKLQLIVDFISGMTDTYAINLFQELKGIKL